MKPGILAGGESVLLGSDGFRKKLRELRDNIEARYAPELRTASFIGRIRLRWRIRTEYHREQRRIAPSPQSLYHSCLWF